MTHMSTFLNGHVCLSKSSFLTPQIFLSLYSFPKAHLLFKPKKAKFQRNLSIGKVMLAVETEKRGKQGWKGV